MNDDPKQVKEKVLEPSWLQQTMALINKCTPDIKGKAFDPDWFVLRQHLEQAAAIIGHDAVYGKEGDEKCAAPVTMESKQPEQSAPSITAASQAAKVTNAAQFEPKAVEPDAKGVQPTQAEQDEKLCEKLRVAFHTATEMGLPFSASALDTAIKRIRELSNGPVEMAHCDKCGLGTNKWHTLCDFCLDESLNEKPQWIPVSQCDLKPGEAFWYLQDDGVRYAPSGVPEPVKWFTSYGGQITHFLRATGCYQIPKPPVKEEDGFEEYQNSEEGFSKVLLEFKDRRDRLLAENIARQAWIARGEALKTKGT